MNKKLFSMAVLSIVLLSSIGVIPVLAQSVSPVSDFEYDLNGDGTGVVILKYVGKGGDIVIFDSIEDFPVVSVGCGFDNENVKTLETLEIPNSIKSIGSGAFKGCENLITVIMPSHKIQYGDDSVFVGCKKLSLKSRKMIRNTGYIGGF